MTTATKPSHTLAAEESIRVRSARAQLKKEIKAGEARIPDILRSELPDWLEMMSVEKLLGASPMRSTTRNRIYRKNGAFEGFFLSPAQPLGRLTTRQRNCIADQIEDWEIERERRTGAVGGLS